MSAVTETDLQAWVDGALPENRRSEVEGFLAGRPDELDRLRAYSAQNAMLRTLYGPVLDEPVPERLTRVRASSWFPRYALAASMLIFGVAIGWFGRDALTLGPASYPSLARQAAIAHAVYSPEVRHPVEVGADQEDHLVKWLSKRLGTDLKAPHLISLGYSLVGGRLLSGQNGPVAQFMYQDDRGQRLTLYVSAQKGERRDTAFRFSQEDRVSVFYWIDRNYGYALSGEISRDNLLAIAKAVYQQISP